MSAWVSHGRIARPHSVMAGPIRHGLEPRPRPRCYRGRATGLDPENGTGERGREAPIFVPLSVLEFRDRAALFFGDKVGVIDGEEQFTYRCLLYTSDAADE